MGKNRVWDNFDFTKGKVIQMDSRLQIFLVFGVWCLVSVLWGCAGRQIIITKDPLKTEEHIKLAQVYETNGEIELAVEEYKNALEYDKTNPMPYFGLGNISYKKGKYMDAEDYYKKAIATADADDPRNAMFYNNLSWIYIDTDKELKQAEALAQKAMLLDDEGGRIYLDTLGVIYTKLKEYAKAEEALLSAFKNAPDDKTALRHINMHLLELYRAQGANDKMHEIVERLKGLDK